MAATTAGSVIVVGVLRHGLRVLMASSKIVRGEALFRLASDDLAVRLLKDKSMTCSWVVAGL